MIGTPRRGSGCGAILLGAVVVTVVARGADAPPTLKDVASRYADLLESLTENAKDKVSQQFSGPFSTTILERFKVFRRELTTVDRLFCQASRDAPDGSNDESLIKVGEPRWLPRDRLSDLQTRLEKLVTQVGHAIAGLNEDYEHLQSKFAMDEKQNNLAVATAERVYRDIAAGKAQGVWVTNGIPGWPLARPQGIYDSRQQLQAALSRRDRDRGSFRDQSGQLQRRIAGLSALRRCMNLTVLVPIAAAQARLARKAG